LDVTKWKARLGAYVVDYQEDLDVGGVEGKGLDVSVSGVGFGNITQMANDVVLNLEDFLGQPAADR
jgi:hypothetical protein